MSVPACMCVERALRLARQQRAAAQQSLWCQCSALSRVQNQQLLSQQSYFDHLLNQGADPSEHCLLIARHT